MQLAVMWAQFFIQITMPIGADFISDVKGIYGYMVLIFLLGFVSIRILFFFDISYFGPKS